jgi:hypothetical protein
MITLLLGLFHL